MPAESDKIIREKISGMDMLPAGIELNSAARWQQLEHALQPPKKRIAKWYYVAAVFLGIAATCLVLNTDKKPFTAVAVSKSSVTPGKPATNFAQRPVVTKKNTVSALPFSKRIVIPMSDSTTAEPAPVLQKTDLVQQTQKEPVIDTPVNAGAPKPNAVTAKKEPVKPKRFKVVHLNELGIGQELIITNTSLKKIQLTEEAPEEQTPSQINKAWWQPKPKPVTAITDHP